MKRWLSNHFTVPSASYINLADMAFHSYIDVTPQFLLKLFPLSVRLTIVANHDCPVFRIIPSEIAISDILNGTIKPPLPLNQGWKMAHFSLPATSSLIFFLEGGRVGDSAPCYSVRDCRLMKRFCVVPDTVGFNPHLNLTDRSVCRSINSATGKYCATRRFYLSVHALGFLSSY